MQVFKAFLKTSKKYLPTNVIYFIIFTVIALAATNFNTDEDNSSFKTDSLNIGVIDEDQTDTSQALEDYLKGMHQITLLENEKETLLDGLFYRSMDYVLILPKGFEERLCLGEGDALYETVQIPGIYSSMFVDEQVNSYLKTLQVYLAAEFPLEEALSAADRALGESSNQVKLVEFEKGEGTSSTSTAIYFFYQFLAYVMISMILNGLTPILTVFWEKSLAKRISCSSTSLLSRNLQIAFGSVIYCLAVWALFMASSRVFYGPEMFSQKGLLCIANSFLLLPLGVAISLTIACFSPTANAINMINNILTLGMSFLCGIFIPQQQLGADVLSFSKYLPFYWYIKNNDLIDGFSGKAEEVRQFWQNMGIQAAFCIAIFAVALAVSKYKNASQKA